MPIFYLNRRKGFKSGIYKNLEKACQNNPKLLIFLLSIFRFMSNWSLHYKDNFYVQLSLVIIVKVDLNITKLVFIINYEIHRLCTVCNRYTKK